MTVRRIVDAAVRADSALERKVYTTEDRLMESFSRLEETVVGAAFSKVAIILVVIGFVHLATR